MSRFSRETFQGILLFAISLLITLMTAVPFAALDASWDSNLLHFWIGWFFPVLMRPFLPILALIPLALSLRIFIREQSTFGMFVCYILLFLILIFLFSLVHLTIFQ